MPRLFIGVMIPEDVKKYVEELKTGMSALPMDCKMVERENLHICLSFLGDVDDGKVQPIVDELDSICSGARKFDFEIGELLIIPNESHIRVLALRVTDKSEASDSIISGILKSIGGSSHPPHLTLCRVKGIRDRRAVIDGLKSLRTQYRTFHVSSIHLIKSELGRDGPAYSVVHMSMLP
jgi:2'-5' RNA ligase